METHTHTHTHTHLIPFDLMPYWKILRGSKANLMNSLLTTLSKLKNFSCNFISLKNIFQKTPKTFSKNIPNICLRCNRYLHVAYELSIVRITLSFVIGVDTSTHPYKIQHTKTQKYGSNMSAPVFLSKTSI